MCTIVLAWQVFPDAPVVVAANRDESFDRPSEPPAARDWERPTVAPLDREAEGTWIGYNDAGVLVAVTNRWTDDDSEGNRSRGLLVRDALARGSAEDAIRFVERSVRAHEYDGFNLVAADRTAALYVEWDGMLAVRPFPPGVHVVVNVGADGDYAVPASRPDAGEQQATSADRVRTTLQPEPGEDVDHWIDRAKTVIGDHEYGVCIHGDGFGTRSSSVIALDDAGATYEFADGPPCRTEHRSVESHI